MSRYDLTDMEWRAIQPHLPNKVRGVPAGRCHAQLAARSRSFLPVVSGNYASTREAVAMTAEDRAAAAANSASRLRRTRRASAACVTPPVELGAPADGET
jgi:transposase